MSFLYIAYVKYVIAIMLVFVVAILWYEKKYFQWVRKYWFFGRSLKSYLVTFCLLLGYMGLIFSTMDLRGPVEDAKVSIKDQQTIIMIDMSLSMMAEDIRPNRLEKSIVLARHFIKKALGHQISIVAFSDTQRQIIPFTDDVELLDSRLSSLLQVKNISGGSNIKRSVVEAANYFPHSIKGSQGNMLIFSDFENQERFNLTIPENIVLGLVGVGTKEGAPIPIRSPEGNFYRYKTYHNDKVITKLDSNFIEFLSKEVLDAKIWLVGTMDLPTEEIVDYFSKNYEKKLADKNVQVRPVLGHYVVIGGITLIALASLLSMGKTFSMKVFIMCLMIFTNITQAADNLLKQKLLDEMKQGSISKINKLKIAELFINEKNYDYSEKLYKEVGAENFTQENEIYFNYITALMANNKLEEGTLEALYLGKRLSQHADVKSQDMLIKLRKNILFFMSKIDEKNNQNNKGDDKKEKKEGQKNQSNKLNPEDNKKENDKQNAGNDQGQGQQKSDNQMKNPNKENKDQKKSDDNSNKNKENQNLKEKEGQIDQQRKMISIPTVLKQIMDKDKKMQEGFVKTDIKSTYTKESKRDW
ncbi:MAG: hypothetical protein A2202_06245 [Bdellovibrionales bacterium RIFOXYA1_FULL_36_14]|nr:MAG: hypothetical protein A2202_06245 [Bdellovibrionales bacterium RIFOXYA1_FULL_36_14]